MLRELRKQEVQLRELNDIEMEMVSGGEGGEDEVIATGTRQSSYDNPYAGMTGEQIMRQLGLSSQDGLISSGGTHYLPTGGGTPSTPNEDTTSCAEAQQSLGRARWAQFIRLLGSNHKYPSSEIDQWVRENDAQTVQDRAADADAACN